MSKRRPPVPKRVAGQYKEFTTWDSRTTPKNYRWVIFTGTLIGRWIHLDTGRRIPARMQDLEYKVVR